MPPAESLQAASAEQTQAAAPAVAQLAEKAEAKLKKQKEPEAAAGKEDKKRKRAADGTTAAAAGAVAALQQAAAAAPGDVASGDAQKPLSKKQRRSEHATVLAGLLRGTLDSHLCTWTRQPAMCGGRPQLKAVPAELCMVPCHVSLQEHLQGGRKLLAVQGAEEGACCCC